MTGWDDVVVGAGGAGAVVAARLSEDPARRVLLVEAGPVPATLGAVPSALLDAARVPGAEAGSPFNWWYPAQLAPDRDWEVTRGRVAGGSTATNGAYFVRPRRADLDRWSRHGDRTWAWDAVLPRLRALERDLDLGATAVHGDRGPVPVRRGDLDHSAAAAFVRAALAAGHPAEPDKNDEGPPGVGPVPLNATGGVRWSTVLTHLLPALGRPNLEVAAGSTALRVLTAAGRVTGLVVRARGRTVALRADRVVLAAGALATPVLLLRSGIGPAAPLRAAGVDVVLDAPAVGGALSDHPQVAVDWFPSVPQRAPEGSWVGGLLTASTADDDGSGDLEVLQSLRPTAGLTRTARVDALAPLPLLVSVHTPEPTGRIELDPRDLEGRPRIRFDYLATSRARRRLRDAVGIAAEVLHGMRDGRADPALAPALRDASELDAWIRARLATALHTCSTVPFRLPDGSEGPVDDVGRVRGVHGLRVADTSILPAAPLRGPSVTAVLIGETVAASMRRTSPA